MQRFVYVPRVEAYIRLEEENRIVDISEDIISGSIQLRLNAMSEAELTLQNKHGRYTRIRDPIDTNQLKQEFSGNAPNFDSTGGTLITPMDRIIIRMSRVGQPENVFAGYIDGSPHYQMYSGPVTIRASCVLKLLQHTYFDPGLMSMASMFQKYGWVPIDTSGDLISKEHFDAMDSTGSVKDLITGMLIDVAEWSPSMIQIRDLPPKLIQDIGTIMVAEEEELTKEYQEVLKRLGQFFAIDTSGGAIDVGGIGPGGSAVPVTGNVPPEDIAALLMDNGLDVDTTTKLVAIARRESS